MFLSWKFESKKKHDEWLEISNLFDIIRQVYQMKYANLTIEFCKTLHVLL